MRTMEQTEPVPAAPPPRAYLSRLPLFRALEPDLIAELLDAGSILALPRGCVVQQQGAPGHHCYVTLNGAIEEFVQRRGSRLRVSFTGPGHAFGFIGLLDAEPAPATAVTRERSVLLAIDGEHFMALLSRGGRRCRSFAAAVEADLVAAMLTAERTLSHLAARSA
jgi:CRP-like cAMP-binding protein